MAALKAQPRGERDANVHVVEAGQLPQERPDKTARPPRKTPSGKPQVKAQPNKDAKPSKKPKRDKTRREGQAGPAPAQTQGAKEA
jgi:hypothetical protein